MAQIYTSNYANNVPNMSNSELVGMAKNRYTDSETMLAITKGYYRLAKEYLSENPNITPEAAQELWNHRGYVFKATLLSNGFGKRDRSIRESDYKQGNHRLIDKKEHRNPCNVLPG